MRRSARRAALAVAAAGVLLLGGAAVSAWTQPTGAAWTDSAAFTAGASSGTWSTGPGSCSLEKLPGYTGVWGNPTCTVTQLRVDVPWGSPGTRKTNMYASLSFAGTVDGGQQQYFRIVVTLNLAAAIGMPKDWNWSTTGVEQGNLLARASDYQCSSLTQPGAPFKAYVSGNYWNASSIFFPVDESWAGIGGLICP